MNPKILIRLCVLGRDLRRDIVLSGRGKHNQRAIPEVSGASHLCRAQSGEYLILIDRSELMFGRKHQEAFFLPECFRPECRRIVIRRQASPAKMELKEIFQLFPAGSRTLSRLITRACWAT